ncbi:MAG: Fic family protein [Candidatus Diapherotrites archaeon CG09_land_8_20_14_0_10_32_12]|nr:MAG: Fic family protein [Candidatus Diapherotrites archaeon CG09_land_8_20_14_0_10_32_12]
MFIEKKKYKHKIKYYLAMAYKENGNTKKIRRYLGENLAEIELEKKRGQAEKFLQDKLSALKVQRDPLKYALSKDDVEYINKLIKNASLKTRPYSVKEWKLFYESFTYNTNAIEGSRLEFKEVKALFEEKSWANKPKEDIAEALGVESAITYSRKTKEHISEKLIKHLHYLVFKNSKDFAGEFRTSNVVVVDYLEQIIHRGAPPQSVKSLVVELAKWYQKNKKKYHPLVLAAIIHNQFEVIHPFADGNGRVGRLLLNNILMRHGLPPLIITYKNRAKYYQMLQAYQNQYDITTSVKFLLETYKKTFKEIK